MMTNPVVTIKMMFASINVILFNEINLQKNKKT